MKRSLRKNVAIAIDGGGIRGVMVAKALAILEEHLKTKKGGYVIKERLNEIVRLTAGTSTGSIISACLAHGIGAEEIHSLYLKFGRDVFKGVFLRGWLNPPRYKNDALRKQLEGKFGKKKMSNFWDKKPEKDVVITVHDMMDVRTRFVKPWNKPEEEGDVDFTKWPIVDAVLASCAVPIYFPTIKRDGRDYADGGIGSYGNPAYLAAYEIYYCLDKKLGWKPKETTLISIGTGRPIPYAKKQRDSDKFWTLKWIKVVLDAYAQSANNQQVGIVGRFFKDLDFRRFNLKFADYLDENIEMDDYKKMDILTELGKELGKKIINDERENED